MKIGLSLYLAFSTSSEYLSDLKTIQINRKISLLLARSKLFNSKEKQRTAKVLCSLSMNFTCLFSALVKRCIVWLQHEAKYDLDYMLSLSSSFFEIFYNNNR